MNLIRVSNLAIQSNRGKKRIWIEGRFLEQAGFSKGKKIRVQFLKELISINLDKSGPRVVCGKKTPIIDINNKAIGRIFRMLEKVKVAVSHGEITITRTKLDARIKSAKKDRSCGSVFTGGGILDEAARKNKFSTKFAIELERNYADICQDNHKTSMHQMDIASVDLDSLPQVEMLVAGIPCEPFSKYNIGKDFHGNCDLSMFFLMVVERTNPRIIVMEEVPYYVKSEIGQATMQALKRMGYNVDYRIYSGLDFGELEYRKRAIIIASYGRIKFPNKTPRARTMGEILENPNNPNLEWFSKDSPEKQWIFKSMKKSLKDGNYFQAQIITEDSTSIQAITKRYWNIQPQNPLVKHPTKDLYRLLTIEEGKRLKTIPKSYNLGKFHTIAGQVIGQSLIMKIFQRVIGVMA